MIEWDSEISFVELSSTTTAASNKRRSHHCACNVREPTRSGAGADENRGNTRIHLSGGMSVLLRSLTVPASRAALLPECIVSSQREDAARPEMQSREERECSDEGGARDAQGRRSAAIVGAIIRQGSQ